MIGTDLYSYQSRLKDVSPTAKVAVSAVSVVLCLCAGGVLVGAFTVLFFCVLIAQKGGTSPRVFFRLMRTPFLFLLIGTVTIIISRFAAWDEVLFGVRLGQWIYGVSPLSLQMGTVLIVRALGCIASVYFTVLTTPITDLLLALRRMHVPQLFLALMELIYRFIFVLYETVRRIHTAQASRLGYHGLRRSYHSTGELISTVFLKAYRKSDKIYTALEARGYTGMLSTLPQLYTSGSWLYALCAALTASQLALALFERRMLPF